MQNFTVMSRTTKFIRQNLRLFHCVSILWKCEERLLPQFELKMFPGESGNYSLYITVRHPVQSQQFLVFFTRFQKRVSCEDRLNAPAHRREQKWCLYKRYSHRNLD